MHKEKGIRYAKLKNSALEMHPRDLPKNTLHIPVDQSVEEYITQELTKLGAKTAQEEPGSKL